MRQNIVRCCGECEETDESSGYPWLTANVAMQMPRTNAIAGAVKHK